jgi:ornithine decarboxylase
MDLDAVREKYRELARLLPQGKIHYAVKANPAVEIVSALAKEGSYFDIASPNELDRVLSLGVSAAKISYGNTIKKEKDIEYAFKKGVQIYACDSEDDLMKQVRAAPGTKVFFRISTDGSGADWPLSKKFGSHPEMVLDLAKKAKTAGLIPYGISFHVGSQQRDIGQWDSAIANTKHIFDTLSAKGIDLKMVNLGGGLPCSYMEPTQNMDTYISEIMRYMEEHFGSKMPEIFIEPGRALVGDAGMIATDVVLIAKKSKTDLVKWVYLDIGLFGGMIECLGEAIKYPLLSEKSGKLMKVILAGPTCDSMDILYQNHIYTLPESLQAGDKLYFFSTGAYTTSYSSVEFNGFPPLKAYYI